MRLRLMLAFTLVALISVISVVLIFRSQTTAEVRFFVRRGAGSGLGNVVTMLEDYYVLKGSWDGVERLMKTLLRPRQYGMNAPQSGVIPIRGLRWRLTDERGTILYDTENRDVGRTINSRERETATSIEVNRQIVGWLVVDITQEFENRSMAPFLDRIDRAAILAAVFAGVLALFLGFGLSYGLVQPIKSLIEAAGRLGQGDLSQRVDVNGGDELAALGLAFNRMAESLQRAEESRRAMTADIAHELRTPLSVQRAQLEAMSDGVYEFSTDGLESVLEQNALLTRLVEDLRTLTQADTGNLLLNCVPVDFIGLVEKVTDKFLPEAQTKGVQIERHFNTNCLPLNLDTDRVEQILGNLLSNALRYTPREGKIVLSSSNTREHAELTIHDSGLGIPIDALPFIFERFYRADKSRSRHEGGSGLGLAIARQFARAHGGDITATNHPDGGAIFTLTFPLIRDVK